MMEPEIQEELPGPSWLPLRWDPECPVHQHLMEAAKCLRETGRFEDAWPRVAGWYMLCNNMQYTSEHSSMHMYKP
jgi:hypothetical protein